MDLAKEICTLENYIHHIREDMAGWGTEVVAWFRGEPKIRTQLLPRVYRPKVNGTYHNENQLLQMFRMKAPAFAAGQTPDRAYTDQWLFLAQHVGLPTRLLDWTESALAALHFALEQDDPVVWMLNPILLNSLSLPEPAGAKAIQLKAFPLTWFDPQPPMRNIGHANIKAAWDVESSGLDLPVAVQPTYAHPRMSAQRSVFTVHGSKKESLNAIPQSQQILRRYDISANFIDRIKTDLQMLGVNYSTAFPDLDGLAKELRTLY